MSEILTNDNFLRLMIDAEIYVDGNVTTQFHTLNKMVDAQCMILVKKLHPDDYNLQAEALKKISKHTRNTSYILSISSAKLSYAMPLSTHGVAGADGGKESDLFIQCGLSFPLRPILTLGNAVLAPVQ